MPLFVESELRSIGRQFVLRKALTAGQILKEEVAAPSITKTFDVFLSHSKLDEEVVLGIYSLLTTEGFSVYVDWIEDPQLNRSNVTPEHAELIRTRMKRSKSMIYAYSNNSATSVWMCWELGFFDGTKGKVSILPVAKDTNENFKGAEFVGLYPYIDKLSSSAIFVNRGRAPATAILREGKPYSHNLLKEWVTK